MTNLFAGPGSFLAFASDGKKGRANKAPLPNRNFRLDKFFIRKGLGPQIGNNSVAVRKAVDFQTHEVSQGEPEVGIQSSALALDKPALLDLSLTLACDDHGKVEKLVSSPVAQTRAESEEGVFE